MTIRERFIPYTRDTRGRTFADPTAVDAFHYPTKADKPKQRPISPNLKDPNCASEEDIQRFEGLVFEPDRPISKSQLRRLLRIAMWQNQKGTK